jgi:hypothetical protein
MSLFSGGNDDKAESFTDGRRVAESREFDAGDWAEAL